MKLLIWVPSSYSAGGSRLFSQLLPALAQQSTFTSIKVIINASPERAQLLALPTHPKLEVTTTSALGIPLNAVTRVFGIRGTGRLKRFIQSGSFDASSSAALIRCALNAERDCDVVYVFWPHQALPVPFTKPVVCTYQDTTLLDFPEILGAKKTLQERLQSETWLRLASKVIVPSDSVWGAVERHFSFSAQRMVKIPHAIVASNLVKPESSAPQSEMISAKRYLLCPVNQLPHKNLSQLLVAWSRFPDRDDMMLVIVGPSTQVFAEGFSLADVKDNFQAALYGLVDRLGLRRGIDIQGLGYVPDHQVTMLMQNAYGLVMPTLAEGGGSFPVEEALASGVPVLCSDIPVLREQLQARTQSIVWFDPLSPETIVAALGEFKSNYARYKQNAESSRTAPRPSWNEIAGRYASVFEQLNHD